MAATAGDILVETLIDWGVDAIFGIPGDGINGIMEALRTRQDQIRFVQVRHEEAAAFMACAYAKFTGRLGVLPRHLGAGRHPSAERPLRRQARRPAGARDHRPAVPRSDRHLHPAGRRARQAVHGRLRLQRAGHGPGPCRERRRARLPHRARPSRSRPRHHSGRRAVDAGEQGRPLGAQHPAPRLERRWRASGARARSARSSSAPPRS